MIKHLYDELYKRWFNGRSGSIWMISDPHFDDPEMPYIRRNYIGDDEQIKRINSKVGKNDVLICLGDVGDVSWVKRLHGYKILIEGNHDAGYSNYIRKVENRRLPFKFTDEERAEYDVIREYQLKLPIDGQGDYYACIAEQNDFVNKCVIKHLKDLGDNLEYSFKELHYDENDDTWYSYVKYDNHLFDEVYEGPLVINEKIILSHEPIPNLPFMLNIHGHDHSNREGFQDLNHWNICAEWINYTPINFNEIIKSGRLNKIDSLHRVTIDTATENGRKSK